MEKTTTIHLRPPAFVEDRHAGSAISAALRIASATNDEDRRAAAEWSPCASCGVVHVGAIRCGALR